MKNLLRMVVPAAASKDFLSKFMAALPEDTELLSAQRLDGARGPLELRIVSASFPEDKIATEAVGGVLRVVDGKYEFVMGGNVLITFEV